MVRLLMVTLHTVRLPMAILHTATLLIVTRLLVNQFPVNRFPVRLHTAIPQMVNQLVMILSMERLPMMNQRHPMMNQRAIIPLTFRGILNTAHRKTIPQMSLF